MARTSSSDEGFQAIRAEDTVGEIARHRAGALEVMKRMGINHCCGAQLTLNEAAAATGVPLEELLAALNESARPNIQPRAAGAGTRHVELDVRDDLRSGREPLAKIMAAAKALGKEDVLVLRAPFEPIPLYKVLATRGFAHWTEHRGADDWSVFFYRDASVAPTPPSASRGANGRRTVLDVRGLEPPEPMVRVLEELDRLGPGVELEVRHDRRPMFLYPQLDARGFVHETDQPEPGLVRIVIRSTGS